MNPARRNPPKTRSSNVVTQDQLSAARGRNLRQMLLRTTRTLSALIETELVRRGYDDVRLAHGTLLANLDLEGNSITQVAERAHMTKQAMGILAEELEAMGYIKRRVDERDARARVLTFTARGRKLILATSEIVDQIERDYAQKIGQKTMDGLRAGLQAFDDLGASADDSRQLR